MPLVADSTPSATIRVLTGSLAGVEAEIAPGRPLLVGRDAACGLRLPGLEISRAHARFELSADGLRVECLSGVNPVYVNGMPRTAHTLGLWDMVGVGPHVLRVESLNGACAGGVHRELRADASLLACLLEIQRLLSTDAERMVERALDSLFLALPATRLSLFAIGEDGEVQQGHTVARSGLPTTHMSHGFVRHVLAAGGAVLLGDEGAPAPSPATWEATMREQAVRAVIGVPVRHGQRTVAVLLCDNLERPGALDHTHLEVLAAVGRALEHVFQRADLRRLERDRVRAEIEFEAAQAVQRTLLGRDPAHAAGPWRWAAAYRPARELGGDYFDHGVDASGITLVVADVSGKGVGAGIVVGMLRIAFKELWSQGLPPDQLLLGLERRLRGELPTGMFFTALAAHLAPDGLLRWAGLGHPEGVVMRGAEVAALLESGTGILGIMPEAWVRSRLATREMRLQPGDRLFLCTDGLTEALDPAGDMFGMARIQAALARHAAEPPAAALDGMLAAVAGFIAGGEQSDDIALLAGDYRP